MSNKTKVTVEFEVGFSDELDIEKVKSAFMSYLHDMLYIGVEEEDESSYWTESAGYVPSPFDVEEIASQALGLACEGDGWEYDEGKNLSRQLDELFGREDNYDDEREPHADDLLWD